MEYDFFLNGHYRYDYGFFIERPNRFIANVKYNSKIIRCHVPDSGNHQWKMLPILGEYDYVKPEFSVNKKSRLDFLFTKKEKDEPPCLVEIKTVTLIFPENSGIGLFPDAPTKRGSKHIEELILEKEKGKRCIILFIVPRIDVKEVRPNFDTDPTFSSNLIKAKECGVEIIAFRCPFTDKGIKFGNRILVNLVR